MKSPSLYVFLAIVIYMFFTVARKKKWETEKIINYDVICYYSYLPAYFIHHDLELSFIKGKENEYDSNLQYWHLTAENGGCVFKMSMGTAIMYSPFFLIARYTNGIPLYKQTGFEQPFETAICYAGFFYAMLGIFFLRKILLRFFSELVTGVTLIVIYFGTNLYYFNLWQPGMSHSYTFFLMAAYLFCLIRWHKKPSYVFSMLIGLLLGMISLVRPVNALFVLIFIFYGIRSFRELPGRFKMFFSNYKFLIVIAVMIFLVWIPQFYYWKLVTGHWLYYSYQGERFYFNNPHVFRGMFSYRNGWLVYTPVMAFALIGIYFTRYKATEFALAICIFLPLFLYVVYSWWCWWYVGFGSRPMIDIYALLAIPFAAIFDFSLKKKWAAGSFGAILLFLVYLNQLQSMQYVGTIHWDSMTKEAYWEQFMNPNKTPNYENYLRTPDSQKAWLGLDEDGLPPKK